MLSLFRAIGILTPILALACTVVLVRMLLAVDVVDRAHLVTLTVLAVLAGGALVALLAWFAFSWRLNRLSRALETTLTAKLPSQLGERGVPAERRLARAFNSAARAFARVEFKSKTDPLTGVGNREALLASLANEVKRANRFGEPLSVAFIDIDRFKPINDTHGHAAGDVVLRQVASIVAGSIRDVDAVGRYGGEEFMLILPGTKPEDAVTLAEKLRLLVMQTPLTLSSGETLRLTISIGIAGGEGGHLRTEQLVGDADAAMYSAKSLGRNQTYVFRSISEDTIVRRAPVSPEGRRTAAAIGRQVSASATEALASILLGERSARGPHAELMATLATRLATHMRLPDDEVERIRIASLLHDLGEIAVPDEILDKEGKLTESEWQGMAEHPRIGQMIIEQATAVREAAPIILHHHERYNGDGYPYGLQGHEIPIGARVVAVADAYHAIVTDRPYQPARTHQEALDEIRRNAGTQFDPAVVEVFLQVYRHGVPGYAGADLEIFGQPRGGNATQPVEGVPG